MDLYGPLFHSILYPAWEGGIRGRPTLRILRELEATQWLSVDEIHARQSGDLARLLHHAYDNVPYYRERFRAAGVLPSDVRGPEDLNNLPLLRRHDASQAGQTRESTKLPRVEIRKNTGGTTGSPLSFGYERASEHWRQAIKLRGYGWAGYRLGRPALHLWGPAPPLRMAQRLKVAVDRSLKREVYVDCIKRSDEDLAEIVALIRDLRPHAIVAFASAAATLSRYVARTGARTWATIPVLCGAEQLSAPDRESIQHAFGPAVFDTYGSRETMLIASECEAHDGLHTHSENVVVEVIVFDGERQRAAHEGETGHIVVTDLHNHAMPFIRYANGDLGRIRKAGRCDCGRSLPRIEAVEGRVTDTLRDGKGRPVGGLVVLTMMVPIAHAVTQFQAVQHKDASLTFKLVPTSTFDDAARKHVVTTLEKYLPGIPVTLQLVHDIPLSAGGKRRVVIVE